MFTQEPVPVFPDAPPFALNKVLEDGITPLIVTDKSLFYYGLNQDDPYTDLENRIKKIANANQPPFFIVAYGGLSTPNSIFDLIQNMQTRLPSDQFQIIGAQDMVILAKQAVKVWKKRNEK